jgi:hypothetical protein
MWLLMSSENEQNDEQVRIWKEKITVFYTSFYPSLSVERL